MSKIDPRRAQLIRESEILAQTLLEKLSKKAAGVKPEDKVAAKSPHAPTKPTDREKPVPTTKSGASERSLSKDLQDMIEEFLSSGDPKKSKISKGIGLEDKHGVKMTVSGLPTPEVIKSEKGKGVDRTAFYVEPNGAPDIRVGSRPGDDPPDVPITVRKIKDDEIAIA